MTHVRRHVATESEPFAWLAWCGERNPASSISTTFVDEVAAGVVVPMAASVEMCPDCLRCMTYRRAAPAPEGHGERTGTCDYEGCGADAECDAEFIVTTLDGKRQEPQTREFCSAHAMQVLEGLVGAGEPR